MRLVRAALVVMLVIALGIPSATAGTAASPELQDPAGDVEYSFLDQSERDYLDITKAWTDFQTENRTRSFTIETVTNSGLSEARGSWNLECGLRWRVVLGDEWRGTLLVRYTIDSKGALASLVLFTSVAGESNKPLPHEFVIGFSAPGHVRFIVNESALLNLGDKLETPQAFCKERFTDPLGQVETSVQNSDGAQNVTTVRIRGPGSPGNPEEVLTSTAIAAEPTAAKAPAFGGVLLGGAVLAVVVARRLRSRTQSY